MRIFSKDIKVLGFVAFIVGQYDCVCMCGRLRALHNEDKSKEESGQISLKERTTWTDINEEKYNVDRYCKYLFIVLTSTPKR